jgi:two-component sensor histidine kinase
MVNDEDLYLKDLRHRIREDMQVVQIQFDIMNGATDKCGDISHATKYVECVDALEIANKQIMIFQDRSNELAMLISELAAYLKSKAQ